jgi:hypothetical protein
MVIGLSGAKRSGKNTAATFIAEHFHPLGYNIQELSFAKALKESAAACFGYKGDAIAWADRLKEIGNIYIEYSDGETPFEQVSGREFLQYYGTEAHRDIFGVDFWVDAVLPQGFTHTNSEIFLITDARFPNEAEAIKSPGIGGKVIEIVRPSIESSDSHASEKPLPRDLIDHTLVNDTDLESFKRNLIPIVEEIVNGR